MSSGDMLPIHLGQKGKKTEEREGKKLNQQPCFVSHYCSNSGVIENGLNVFRNM